MLVRTNGFWYAFGDHDPYDLTTVERGCVKALAFIVFVLVAGATAGGCARQTARQPDYSGRYEGLAKSQSHGDVPVVFEIRQARGTVTGQIHTPLGDFEITRSNF